MHCLHSNTSNVAIVSYTHASSSFILSLRCSAVCICVCVVLGLHICGVLCVSIAHFHMHMRIQFKTESIHSHQHGLRSAIFFFFVVLFGVFALLMIICVRVCMCRQTQVHCWWSDPVCMGAFEPACLLVYLLVDFVCIYSFIVHEYNTNINACKHAVTHTHTHMPMYKLTKQRWNEIYFWGYTHFLVAIPCVVCFLSLFYFGLACVCAFETLCVCVWVREIYVPLPSDPTMMRLQPI